MNAHICRSLFSADTCPWALVFLPIAVCPSVSACLPAYLFLCYPMHWAFWPSITARDDLLNQIVAASKRFGYAVKAVFSRVLMGKNNIYKENGRLTAGIIDRVQG